MRFGLAVPTCGPLAGPKAIRQVAQKAEELGLDSIWVQDHISYGRDWLGHRSSGVSEQITSDTNPDFYESISTLSYIAGFTERIKLGIGILVLPLRNPLVLGRQLITLQGLSAGRLVLGTAIGDYPTEFRLMGVPYERRVNLFEEYLQVLVKILRGGSVSHHGRFLHFDDAHFYPQVNLPPILIGGGVIAVPEPGEDRLAMPVLRRVARFGDGWMPDWGRAELIERGAETIKLLAHGCGRGQLDFQIELTTKLFLANSDEEALRSTGLSLKFAHEEANIVAKFGTRTASKASRLSLIGSTKTLTERIENYARAGVTGFKMTALTPDVDSLLHMMEKFIKEVASSF